MAYGVTLLILLLNATRESKKKEIMNQITCSKCGRLYPEDAAECPGCKTPNKKNTMKQYVCSNQNCCMVYSEPMDKCAFCGSNVKEIEIPVPNPEPTNTTSTSSKHIDKEVSETGGWYIFAVAMIILQLCASAILLLIALLGDEKELLPYAIGGIIGIFPWVIIILLSKIEYNTRKR